MRKRFFPYLFLSLLLHLLAILFFKMPNFSWESEKKLAEPIWIDVKKGQYEIADILPPLKEEKPDDTKFLGMYDSKTPEEWVAQTPFHSKEKQEKVEQKPKLKDSYGTLPEAPKTPSPLAMIPDLHEDFHPDFRRGEHTYLNVLRFPDIQYFVRLKRVFKMTFNPISPLQEAYFRNQIIGGKVETVLGVAVDSQGNLAELFVFRGSGIEGFDEEALRTIRASAPFSKPPAKLLEGDGLLRMSWIFTVYL